MTDTSTPAWTAADAEAVYHLLSWSDGYFSVNADGHVAVHPVRTHERSVDLYDVLQHVREENIALPALLRFQDVLHGRVAQLNQAFARGIEELGYEGRYIGIYPIKVNQLHEVVEEVLEAGRRYGLGLECGSKAELVATLPHLDDDTTPLICNGYKDNGMLRLILMGQQLGKNVLPVLEKYEECERLIAHIKQIEETPRLQGGRVQFGVRVHLATRGSGKWAESSGDRSKFGISIPELLQLITRLEEEDLLEAFVLLHFHLGSQIADIQTLRRAVKEITQVYVQLRQRDVPLQYVDVGGGLGVNYSASYDLQEGGINYTLQEYANAVISGVQDVCDASETPCPTLLSESGRALTAHHSVLVVDVNHVSSKGAAATRHIGEDRHALLAELCRIRAWVEDLDVPAPAASVASKTRSGDGIAGDLLEAYHDAVATREEAQTLFALGFLPIEILANAEDLFWIICRSLQAHLHEEEPAMLPPELAALDEQLVDLYHCNFSVFQSILDFWAIGQRFPIMPVHRLEEPPTRRGILVDLTCDSDGRVDRFIDPDEDRGYLPLHPLREGESYTLGFFLMGAYQDIMGDVHNLFGRVSEVHVYEDEDEPEGFYVETTLPGATVEEILAQVQYFPNDLHRRMRSMVREKIQAGELRSRAGMQMIEQYISMFQQHTYLENP